jgi:carbon storage regulator
MLVLTRRIGERIFIGDNIVIMVTDVQGCSVKIGIEAPREVRIVREELLTEEKPDDPA